MAFFQWVIFSSDDKMDVFLFCDYNILDSPFLSSFGPLAQPVPRKKEKLLRKSHGSAKGEETSGSDSEEQDLKPPAKEKNQNQGEASKPSNCGHIIIG
jgi:hypothetical protein